MHAFHAQICNNNTRVYRSAKVKDWLWCWIRFIISPAKPSHSFISVLISIRFLTAGKLYSAAETRHKWKCLILAQKVKSLFYKRRSEDRSCLSEVLMSPAFVCRVFWFLPLNAAFRNTLCSSLQFTGDFIV